MSLGRNNKGNYMRLNKSHITVAVLMAGAAWAADFEVPPEQPASASLAPELASGPNFHVSEPVQSDGLMHHYVIESSFGQFPAYGQDALKIRVREVAALTELSKKTDIGVVTKTVEEGVENDAKTVRKVVTNPVGTITGIPKGIGHLFSGYKAQANEFTDRNKSSDDGKGGSNVVHNAKEDATRYADRYLGVSAAERRYYAELGVDPYTNNAVLRKAVHHLAKVQATVNLGMHFVGVPGVPYLADVQRAMDAIYNEDPAVLRERQRKTLAGYGLSPAEVARFENTLLLSPTRQTILVEDAKMLDGVDGRGELFRHAMGLTSDEEVGVFIASTRMLVRLHAQEPISRIFEGLRLPTAETRDGKIVILGAFDAVYWTEEVAGYEAALRAALPPESHGLEVWLSGSVSPETRRQLTSHGWVVHEHAEDELPKKLALLVHP
jgi:hypothetical protein